MEEIKEFPINYQISKGCDCNDEVLPLHKAEIMYFISKLDTFKKPDISTFMVFARYIEKAHGIG